MECFIMEMQLSINSLHVRIGQLWLLFRARAQNLRSHTCDLVCMCNAMSVTYLGCQEYHVLYEVVTSFLEGFIRIQQQVHEFSMVLKAIDGYPTVSKILPPYCGMYIQYVVLFERYLTVVCTQ